MTGFVRAPGRGEAYRWHDSRIVFKATSAHTRGQLAVMECTYPAGLVVPTHVHDGEDEMFYLLAGAVSGYCGDDRWIAEPGTFVFVPRDQPHGFTVLGDRPATALVVVGPPRLDGQIAASGVALDGPDDR
jgi:quercetin dioxygenase-like cupin family protein